MMNNTRKQHILVHGSLDGIQERVARRDGHNHTRAEKETVPEYRCLMQFLKPLVYSMVATGIYFMTVDGIPVSPAGVSVLASQKKCAIFRSTFLYNLILVGLLWMNLLRVILAFFIGDLGSEFTTYKVIFACWLALCSANATIMLKVSHPRTGSLLKFFKYWNTTVLQNFRSLNIMYDKPKMHFKLHAALIIAWLVIILNIVFSGLLTFGGISTTSDGIDSVFVMPMPVNTLTKCLTFIMGIFCTFAWIFPFVLFIIICAVVKNGFCLLTKAVKQEIRNCPEVYAPKLHYLRKTHLSLCRSVEILDKDFGLFFASWYAIIVPLGCFILYNTVNVTASTLQVVINLFWLFSGVLSVGFTSAFAAKLHEAAHSPQQYIYDICLHDVTNESLGQVVYAVGNLSLNEVLLLCILSYMWWIISKVNLFVSKLNGPAIGFTVITLVTITKELLLTVAGLFLTYFFLLLQFKI